MSGLKGGALLLVLGIPFALYGAWQVHGVTQLGAGVPPPPPDNGPTKEQLAKASADAAKWAGESRKAVEVTSQYRAAGPADSSTDPAIEAAVKAAAARAADLTDLDTFLSEVEKPVFTGKLKLRYDGWINERAATRSAEKAVTDWLRKPLVVTSAADADKVMEEGTKLLNEYAAKSRFANKGKVAEWRLTARSQVITALAAQADKQYAQAVRAKLPLEHTTNVGTTAVSTLRGLKAQLTALGADLKQADEDKVVLDAAFRKAIEGKSANADEYTAREELLALFAQDDLFTNATGAEPWLKKVAEQYAKTKDGKVQKLIRDKVQEFAEAFVPVAVRLDDEVLLKGERVPRKVVVVSFEPEPGKGKVKKALSPDVDGFNEFEIARKPPGFNQLVTDGATEYELNDLKPTQLSKAAVMFNETRAMLTARPAPRWTAKSVWVLKNQCDPQKELVDQLRAPGTGVAGDPPKIATRVAGLHAGISACKELFDPAP